MTSGRGTWSASSVMTNGADVIRIPWFRFPLLAEIRSGRVVYRKFSCFESDFTSSEVPSSSTVTCRRG